MTKFYAYSGKTQNIAWRSLRQSVTGAAKYCRLKPDTCWMSRTLSESQYICHSQWTKIPPGWPIFVCWNELTKPNSWQWPTIVIRPTLNLYSFLSMSDVLAKYPHHGRRTEFFARLLTIFMRLKTKSWGTPSQAFLPSLLPTHLHRLVLTKCLSCFQPPRYKAAVTSISIPIRLIHNDSSLDFSPLFCYWPYCKRQRANNTSVIKHKRAAFPPRFSAHFFNTAVDMSDTAGYPCSTILSSCRGKNEPRIDRNSCLHSHPGLWRGSRLLTDTP